MHQGSRAEIAGFSTVPVGSKAKKRRRIFNREDDPKEREGDEIN